MELNAMNQTQKLDNMRDQLVNEAEKTRQLLQDLDDEMQESMMKEQRASVEFESARFANTTVSLVEQVKQQQKNAIEQEEEEKALYHEINEIMHFGKMYPRNDVQSQVF